MPDATELFSKANLKQKNNTTEKQQKQNIRTKNVIVCNNKNLSLD